VASEFMKTCILSQCTNEQHSYVLSMIDEVVWLGSVASLVAGLATGFGALPVLFTKRVSDKLLDVMLGFSSWRDAGRHLF
jgi:hypothetical protein